MRLALALLIGTALAAATQLPLRPPASAATTIATVTDHAVFPEVMVDGIGMAELSGLGFDRDEGVIHAVSDRGLVFQLRLTLEGDRIAAITPLSAARLTDATGAQLHASDFNPEGLELLNADNGIPGDTELLVVSETGPAAARFSPAGQMLAPVALPGPLMAAAPGFGPNKGVEALSLHPTLGLVALPETPPPAAVGAGHALYLQDGRVIALDGAGLSGSVVKAMATLSDGRLLLLERTKTGKALQPHLRLVDAAACDAAAPCLGQTATAAVPGITDADFEGITQIGPDLFLMVSDDAIRKQQRSVFALLRVATENP